MSTGTTAAVRWVDAADLGELWEGDVQDVEVAGEHVLLVRLLGGEVRAYQGLCPHQEMLLADGDFDADSGVLVCMGHLWEFDVRGGAGGGRRAAADRRARRGADLRCLRAEARDDARASRTESRKAF